MKIIIATGIYPPDIGGPAQYAKHLKEIYEKDGHTVRVLTYRLERKLPVGIRHVLFFLRCLVAFPGADFTIILDTFSAGVPAIAAAKILGTKTLMRVGGDFLWEWYVERTGDLVLLKNFYETRLPRLNWKERTVFSLSRWAVTNASVLIYSTRWQQNLWQPIYRRNPETIVVIENYYGPKEPSFEPMRKNFVASTRPLKWKNAARVRKAFAMLQKKEVFAVYDVATKPFDQFMDIIAHSYAIILVSLGDVSPNMILDAIRYNKPFILTKECGLYDRLKDVGIFVDPENISDIANAIEALLDPMVYQRYKEKIEAFTFTHTWEDIARDFLEAYKKIS